MTFTYGDRAVEAGEFSSAYRAVDPASSVVVCLLTPSADEWDWAKSLLEQLTA